MISFLKHISLKLTLIGVLWSEKIYWTKFYLQLLTDWKRSPWTIPKRYSIIKYYFNQQFIKTSFTDEEKDIKLSVKSTYCQPREHPSVCFSSSFHYSFSVNGFNQFQGNKRCL